MAAEESTVEKKKSISVPLVVLIVLLIVGTTVYFATRPKTPHYARLPMPEKRTKRVTLSGEVVDAWCYASQTMGPGRGESHKACALACSYGGVTMGILEDGTKDLYIAAKSSKPYKGCNDLLIPYIAQKVKVTGWVGDLGGCRVLKIETVEPLEKSN